MLKRLAARAEVWVALVYLAGVALRVHYTLVAHPPMKALYSDMQLYVWLSRELRAAAPLQPWHVTHPLGFPALLALALGGGGSFQRAALLQLAVSALVPLAAGLVGAAAFGRRTALAAIAWSSVYFPFIEYGALFLSEIHFIFWMAIGFAALFASVRAVGRRRALALALGGGVALSLALAMKAVALPAAVTFFAAALAALALRDGRAGLRRWGALCAAAALGALPLVATMARVCTRANRGTFCVAGNKATADFLLGHDGRIGSIRWASDHGHDFQFGSPSAFFRHYYEVVQVPFFIYDGPANAREAWRFIGAHPLEAAALSVDHVLDTFFGPAAWPSEQRDGWGWAHLSQAAFIALLLLPTLIALAGVARRGLRALLASRLFLVLSPVVGLVVTVVIATGEVRYRVPFDLFFIAAAGAVLTREA